MSAAPAQMMSLGLRSGLISLRRPTTDFRDIRLLHGVDVELRRARDDPVQRLVEVERRRFREPSEVHPRDDERFQIRAGETARLQLLNRRRYRFIELQDLSAAALTFLERLRHRLLQERLDAAQDRLIRAAAQAGTLVVADSECEKRRLLELEREIGLGLIRGSG